MFYLDHWLFWCCANNLSLETMKGSESLKILTVSLKENIFCKNEMKEKQIK